MAKVRKIKRKNGFRYMIDFYDQNNERQRMILPEGTLKKDAEDKRLEIEKQLQKSVYVPEKNILNFNEVAEKCSNTKNRTCDYQHGRSMRGMFAIISWNLRISG